MKTAMKILFKEFDTNNNLLEFLNWLQKEKKNLLEEEKEQIKYAYRKGRYNENPFIDSYEAENYYNQTYNQNK